MWFYFIPVIIVLLVILFLSFYTEEDKNNPQNLVALAAKTYNNISEETDLALLQFKNKQFKTLKVSSYKGKIKEKTYILIVKYEAETKSYKVERYE